MSNFDADMLALFGLILLLGGFTLTFLKEMILPMLGLFLLLMMVWGDDICSRNDRLSFFKDHFEKGGEVICKDTHAWPVIISHSRGWEHKGQYLFKGNQGIDILDDQCEILNQSEPHCINTTAQIIIGSSVLIAIFGWMAWMFRRLNQNRVKSKAREESKGAEEMMKEAHHEQKNV